MAKAVYIDFKPEKPTAAKNALEDFFNLMNNSVFGKPMEKSSRTNYSS